MRYFFPLRLKFNGLFLMTGDFDSTFFKTFCSSAGSLSKSISSILKMPFQISARWSPGDFNAFWISSAIFFAWENPACFQCHAHGLSVCRGEWRPTLMCDMAEKIFFLYLCGQLEVGGCVSVYVNLRIRHQLFKFIIRYYLTEKPVIDTATP